MGLYKRITILMLTIILFLIACGSIFLISSTSKVTINGKIHGYLVNSSGDILETIQFTLDAKLTEPVLGNEKLKLTISDFPDSLPFHPIADCDYYEPIPTNTPRTYYSFTFHLYSSKTGAIEPDNGAINMEEGKLILRFKDYDCYLVASSDPNLDPQALLENFAIFAKHYPLG